ncbi:hypothetical protein CVT24_001673 [Panaeolus cyanescens]|uniref:F-box domain-containing protein n=1 Tax=Panaeolus cyanescens TaxID=181874 RepID=A0A409VST8_9AGAR|nr:hypothetical protein CVT24_001673 [Panaeolus cyanescens]
MISYFFGVPLSMLQIQEAKWTISWILLLSVSYTYAISKLSSSRDIFDQEDMKPQQIRKHTLAHAKRLKAARLAQQQLEEMQERLKRGPLPIFDLPSELVLTILGHCSDWPQTYLSLVRVSKYCSRMTQNACLPRMPIILIDERQISSFHLFLQRNPASSNLVHHIWVTPPKEELLSKCTEIVYDCRNLRSLATTVMIFDVSIVRPRRHEKLRHLHLKDVTCLLSLFAAWGKLVEDPKALAPLQHITHLRIIMDRIPVSIALPNLTHFSYRLLKQGVDFEGESVGRALLADKTLYPALQTVIMTQPSPAGLRIRRVGQKRFFVFEIQNGQSELELWCDNARQRAGAGGGLVASIATCPLDVVKTKLQAQRAIPGQMGYLGVLGTVKDILRENGVRGLYRGLGPTILGYLPTWAIYFAVYDGIKTMFGAVPTGYTAKSTERLYPAAQVKGYQPVMREHPWGLHILSAMTAGAASTICTNPLWVIKTRFMTQTRDEIRYKHTLDAALTIWRTEGVTAFYRGLLPSLLGILHVAVQFPLYEQLKILAQQDSDAPLTSQTILLCSAISKMTASVATYPHEVIRTRLQTQRRPLADDMSSDGMVRQHTRRGIIYVTTKLVRKEGWTALYKGLSINLLRTVPNSAVTMLTTAIVTGFSSHCLFSTAILLMDDLLDDIEFGPGHVDHGRVSWPLNLRAISVTLPLPFYQFFTHNDPLSSEDFNEVQKFRESVHVQTSEIEECIQLLNLKDPEEARRLNDQLRGLQKKTFCCDVVQSHIRNLPDDILYNIANIGPRYYAHGSPITTHFPTVLSHVCRAWRQTVHGTPLLWQDMHFTWTTPGDGNEGDARREARLDHFSRLSGHLPFVLRLDDFSLGLDGSIRDRVLDHSVGLLPFFARLVEHCRQRNKQIRTFQAQSVKQLHIVQQLARLASIDSDYPLNIDTCLLLEQKYHALNRVYATYDGEDVARLLERIPTIRHLWIGSRQEGNSLSRELLKRTRPVFSNLKSLVLESPFLGSSLDMKMVLIHWRSQPLTSKPLELEFDNSEQTMCSRFLPNLKNMDLRFMETSRSAIANYTVRFEPGDDGDSEWWTMPRHLVALLAMVKDIRPLLNLTVRCAADSELIKSASSYRVQVQFPEQPKSMMTDLLEAVEEFGREGVELDISVTLPASFYQFFTHNDPPLTEDFNEVQTFRELLQVEMNEIKDNIQLSKYPEEAQRLNNQLRELQKKTFCCNVIQSHVRNLPDDIIYNIANIGPRYYAHGDPTATHFPTVLSHVCRAWRQTIHGTPRLWQDIHFTWTTPGDGNEGDARREARLEHFSRLSGNLPFVLRLDDLSLGLDGSASDRVLDHSVGLLPFFARLVEHCRQRNKQIRTFQAQSVKQLHIVKQLAQMGSIDYPLNFDTCLLLELKYEKRWGAPPSYVGNDLVELLRQIPTIRRLWIGRRQAACTLLQELLENVNTGIRPAFSNLTSLVIETPFTGSTHYMKMIFRLCPNLEVAAFHVCSYIDDPLLAVDTRDTLVHRNMKELGVTLRGYMGTIESLFVGLQFPSVVSLQLQYYENASQMRYSTPPPIVIFPSLETLVVSLHSEQENAIVNLISFLGTVPTLTDLIVFFFGNYNSALELLDFIQQPLELETNNVSEQTSCPPFLPNLKNMDLRFMETSRSAMDNYTVRFEPGDDDDSEWWTMPRHLVALLAMVKDIRPLLNLTVRCAADLEPIKSASSYRVHVQVPEQPNSIMTDLLEAVEEFGREGVELDVRFVEEDFRGDYVTFPSDPFREYFLTLFR